MITPLEAFNVLSSESLLVLDVSASPQPRFPASAYCDRAAPLLQAAALARSHVLEEEPPDDLKTAAVLFDEEERALDVAQWLLEGRCSRVKCIEKRALVARYGFLFVRSIDQLPVYPTQITPGVFVGSAASANSAALDHLSITHVVSLLERDMKAPPGREHLLCRIPDEEDAQLFPVLVDSLRFIGQALAQDGRVLVHCERGASRSVSVVCAHLMSPTGGSMTLVDALCKVRAQRSCARPNGGFLRQLACLDMKELLEKVM
eukprot:CAMPEP_0113237834 /NCGR_PEP_ID=MMETSP0008_2-20120614/4837_1 /TAXON_ID=97485 /ORGANISM="Prymnesium parvum" /LENGTH=260 /DNA_ID=CAMNT_0000084927 /DNA_START=18 /DNA_END=800 /DNA_ORIENTATION=+ /assembly_acc=CAM_ASM_000153